MQDRKQQQKDMPDDLTGKNHGRQGNDKAPGEEASADMQNAVADTQKGKNKVDGDPSQYSDQPAEQTK